MEFSHFSASTAACSTRNTLIFLCSIIIHQHTNWQKINIDWLDWNLNFISKIIYFSCWNRSSCKPVKNQCKHFAFTHAAVAADDNTACCFFFFLFCFFLLLLFFFFFSWTLLDVSFNLNEWKCQAMFFGNRNMKNILHYPASILRKSTSGRHRPVSYPDGPMTARYRFT